MKSNLLQELEQLLVYEEQMDMALPLPSYLFVQKYGRSIEEEMSKITTLLGKKEWFVFKADESQEKSILNRFLVEQECKSSVGREYTGCILVELTGMENEKELAEFLNYIEEKKHRLLCVYTTKAVDEATEIKKRLSQYGFVRRIDGENYDTYELLEAFEKTVKECHFSISGGARVRLVEWFRRKDWQEQESVVTLIQNMGKAAVYQRILEMSKEAGLQKEDGSCERILKKEEIEDAINEFEGKETEKRQIGFVLEE